MALEERLGIAEVCAGVAFRDILAEDVEDGVEVVGDHVVGCLGLVCARAAARGLADGQLLRVSELLVFRGYCIEDVLLQQAYCFRRTLQSEVQAGNVPRQQSFNKIVLPIF